MGYGIDEQVAEVKAEITMRRRVYARRVADKRMTQQLADRKIATMEAVLATLEEIAKTTRLPF